MNGLSIVVPTKNERTAPAVIAELYKTFGNDTEIIVVDKSNDEFRKPLLESGAKVIGQVNSGYENALMEGFLAANGSVLASIDADGTYAVSDLKRVIGELNKGGLAFVSGSRFDDMEAGAMTGTTKFGNRFITGLFNVLFRGGIRDALSGSFAMTRAAFDTMRAETPYRAGTLFFEMELVRRGNRIKTIPIHYGVRVGSKSQITSMKPAYGIKIAYYELRTRVSPVRRAK